MKYFITIFMLIVDTLIIAQSGSTFYVKKKDNGDVKKVYIIGDKITLLYGYSGDSHLKIKGLINEISEDKIKIDDKWIEVSNIHGIISHEFFKTLIGSVGLAIGIGVILIKRKTPVSEGEIFTQQESIGLTVFPIFFSSVAVLIIPIRYRPETFVFKTYLVPQQ
jgi:hypothetical protein